VHQCPGQQGAALAGVKGEAVDDAGRSPFEVGVLEDEIGRLSAKFQHHALDPLRRLRVNLAADRIRAGEADHVDHRVPGQLTGDFGVAGDHVQHAGRQPGLGSDFAQDERLEGCLRRRLKHGCAAGREGGGEFPDVEQEREVVRRDQRGDADWFA
jgi:hypothetical protein